MMEQSHDVPTRLGIDMGNSDGFMHIQTEDSLSGLPCTLYLKLGDAHKLANQMLEYLSNHYDYGREE